ncbi:imidazole glycerol phosphate synthase subunit HisF [Pontibacillus litoralis]|uniref:Imidazole glycerol phosphate synthase subunit HisF n=1 Tax=Pontibacillus litoralis JSM 072002 TaxID=1385512 RepID=A0A0A5G2E0_9BACI|nr:imidazole glycerol phosphate synthase subunit HisF [Pontibacillus litoralis]KGX86209.1 imidazole glycerol phosphate synthase [Pontibacillus litoralis JSM 072002]
MLTKRIIPCLDVREGRVVKGIQFGNIRDAGDPVQLAKLYDEQGADELVFLDISATNEGRKTMLEVVRQVAATLTIPFTVGGGIASIADMRAILRAGADKVSLNSAAVRNPELIREGARYFGSQCMVVAIDAKYKRASNSWNVYTHGGREESEWNVIDWAQHVQRLGAGELLLTSMDQDGEKSGFDLPLLEAIQQKVYLPVIASGGAGRGEHFVQVFQRNLADAALAASIFHYKETSITNVKQMLKQSGVHVR